MANLNGDNKTLYFGSCVMVIFFIKLGRFIEAKAKSKTTTAISDLMLLTPSYANLLVDGKIKKVTIDEVNEGDLLVCKKGESVAVDGEVESGFALINESLITGETLPKEKEKGSKVIAGAINLDGYIEYKAERIGKNSTVSEIVRTVVEATNSKTKIQRVADTFSKYFVYFVISVALIGFILWWAFSKNFNTSINIFVTVLVVSCPCALGLATPIALVVASGESAKRGILVKDNSMFEVLPNTKNIVFDKTGTITTGELKISHIEYFIKDDNLFSYVASIEAKALHPIAKAITKEAQKENTPILDVTSLVNESGKGLSGIVDNRKILVGNIGYLKENNVDLSDYSGKINEFLSSGKTVIFVSVDMQLGAIITFSDEVRSGVIDLVKDLNVKGIKPILLSGDNEASCKLISSQHFYIPF